MAIYVDAAHSYPDAGLRFTEFCHLLADTRDELHAMADQLELPRRIFQDHPWRWHYDIPTHLRDEAVRLGAIEVTMHEVGALLRARRAAAAGMVRKCLYAKGMRAIAVHEFGGPEALQVVELDIPEPGPGEVRIQVAAATVNPTDTGLRAGLYPLTALTSGPPYIPGMDAAGVIDAVGAGVDWSIGDQVMAIVLPTGPRGGAYAEYIVVPAASVARIPAGMDLVAASTLPMNGLTARRSLDQLDLKPGDTIAVTGAAGSYGGYVVQLAKADGLRVIADASEADEELVRSLGADVIVRRGADVAARIRAVAPEGVDALADGSVQCAAVLAAIKDDGGLAVVRGWAGPAERGIRIHATWVREYATNQAALDRLREYAEQGLVTARVAATFAADQAADAHRRLEAGGTRGRLVITF